MTTFILVSKLSSEFLEDLSKREKKGMEWRRKIAEKCPEVKWIDHYALLGPYDFLDIFEAPNEETAAKVSLLTMSLGAIKAESWPAIPYKRFLELVKEVVD
ncbi:MAG: GYD domain-containing protein [Candidatus Hermodarchaeota archaeon]